MSGVGGFKNVSETMAQTTNVRDRDCQRLPRRQPTFRATRCEFVVVISDTGLRDHIFVSCAKKTEVTGKKEVRGPCRMCSTVTEPM